MRAPTIISLWLFAACGSSSPGTTPTETTSPGAGAGAPGPTEEAEARPQPGESLEALDPADVPAFLRARANDAPEDAIIRLGSRSFQLLDPGTSVQLTFRDDRLEVLERVRGELRVRNAATGETLHTLSAGRGRITPATRSDDGSWIALGCTTVTFQGADRRFRLASPNRPPPAAGMGGLMSGNHYRHRCVAFDADATKAVIAFERHRAVQWVDLESGTAETVEGVSCQPNAVAMAPGGERFACTGRHSVSVVEGAEVREYQGEGHERPHALAFSADGRELAIGYEGEVRIVDAATLEVRARIRTRQAQPTALALSTDGRWLASAAGGAIDVWDRRSGRPVPRPAGHGGRVMSVRLGEAVVLSSAESGEVLRWRVDRPTEAEELLPPAAFWRKLTRSADGRTFAAYWKPPEQEDGQLQRLSPTGELGPLHSTPPHAHHMELSADGSFLVLSRPSSVGHLPLGAEWAQTLWRRGRADGRGIPLADGRIAVGAAHSDTTVTILPAGCAPDCEGRELRTPEPPRQQSARRGGFGRIAAESAPAGGSQSVFGDRRQPRPSANEPGTTVHEAGLQDAVLAGDRIVTAARGDGIHVFDATSRSTRAFQQPRRSRLVAHSSGRVFAMDSLGTLVLLPADVPTPQGRSCTRLEATEWEGAHEGEGTDLDLLGDVVATAGTDGTIVLWSVETLLARENAGS
jgi:hypothetical protein